MLHKLYYWWMEKVLDRHVCKEFTQWEDKRANFTRPVSVFDTVVDYNLKTYKYTEHWQERKCIICGKVEQQKLKY